jgi:hypothetical protein
MTILTPILNKTAFKKIACSGLLLAGALATTGCSTPAYSAKERGQMISRNIGLEWQMMQDDIDHALLLRPVTQGSRWNVR